MREFFRILSLKLKCAFHGHDDLSFSSIRNMDGWFRVKCGVCNSTGLMFRDLVDWDVSKRLLEDINTNHPYR